MSRRPLRRIAILGGIVVLLAVGCTGGGDPENDPSGSSAPAAGVEPPAAPADVEATMSDGSVSVVWSPVEGVPAYRISDGLTESDVPAGVCAADECVVGFESATGGGSVEYSVRSIAGGRYAGDNGAEPVLSDAATATVDVPEPEQTVDPGPLEVVLVRAGTPPTVEVVPVDSEAEAQSVIDGARKPDSGVVSATLNRVAQPAAGNDPDQSGRGPGGWQAEAMHFNQLPGDPPGHGVTVAVVEKGGVQADHPTFGGSVAGGAHVDDDSLSGVSEPDHHATFVASMIAGQPDTGVRGIAPGATILPVDVGDGGEDDLIEGIIWAVDNGADVVNVSLAMYCDSLGPLEFCNDGLRSATEYAESQGVVVVAGAGNNGGGHEICHDPTDAEAYPAVIDTVISVAAHDAANEPFICNPDRPDIDVCAPGVGLLGAQVGGYKIGSGTSYSSPLMAGLIAVILAERPELTPAEFRSMLPQWLYADCRVNVLAALASAGLDPTDDPDLDFDDAEGIYPYSVDLGFEGDHPVSVALGDPYSVDRSGGWHSRRAYSSGGFWIRSQQGVAPFGEIAGLIVVDSEGDASASGVWTYEHGERYGPTEAPYVGHWVQCPSYIGWDPVPARVFRWDVPVVVDVVLQGDPEEPDFDLTFSLGTGARAATAGGLPPMTTPLDTLDNCPDYLAADDGKIIDTGVEWSEVAPALDEYIATMESVYQALIDNSPYSTAEPVSSRFTAKKTVDDDDPRVHIGYTNGNPDNVGPNL